MLLNLKYYRLNQRTFSCKITISKRFYPGGNNLVNTLYNTTKGVSGSFTLSNAMYDQIYQNRPAFNYHLYQHLKFYDQAWFLKGLEQQLFDRSQYLVQKSTLQDHIAFKNYGFLGDSTKPFSLMLPFNQNFISHRFHKYYFDPKKIIFPQDMYLDISQLNNTGMTIQNMMELHIAKPHIKNFTAYFHKYYPEGKIRTVWQNPIIKSTKTHLTNKTVQTNPDSNIVLQYTVNGAERVLPFDTKAIVYPEKYIKLYNGSIALTFNYNIKMHIDRFKASLLSSNTDQGLENYFEEIIDSLSQAMKKKDFVEIQKIFYEMLCNEKNTTIFPTIITEAMVNNEMILSNEDINTLNAFLHKDEITLHIAKLFPEMGKEDNDNFSGQIEYFMEQLPERLSMLHNYHKVIEYINNVATIV